MQIPIANEKAGFHSSVSMNTQISKGTSIQDLSFCVGGKVQIYVFIYMRHKYHHMTKSDQIKPHKTPLGAYVSTYRYT